MNEFEKQQIIERHKESMRALYKKAAVKESAAKQTAAEPYDFTGAIPPLPEEGTLTVMVTAVSRIYPIENANVTVFTGAVGDRDQRAQGFTDISGKTRAFPLPAPAKELSFDSGSLIMPYSLYNVAIKADGYVEQILLNIAVFPGVNSMQLVNLVPYAAAGKETLPKITDTKGGRS